VQIAQRSQGGRDDNGDNSRASSGSGCVPEIGIVRAVFGPQQLSQFLRCHVAAFAALLTMVAAWRSRLIPRENLKMIITGETVSRRCRSQLTANIATIVSG
jgi:hypothetical protein